MPDNTPAARPSFGRFICPNCAAINVEPGNCKKCGADLETGEASGSADNLRQMQQSGGLSKKHLLFGGLGILLLSSAAMMMMGGHQEPAPTSQATNAAAGTAASPVSAGLASQIASQYAGFKTKPPEGYTYADTTADNPGVKSFGIESQARNQKILFLVWDNTAPVENLDLVLHKVPAKNLDSLVNDGQVEKGSRTIGNGPMPFYVGRYTADSKTQMVLIAAYKSPVPGKAIVVIARPFDESDKLDYNGSLWLVDDMAAEYSAQAKKSDDAASSTGTANESEPLATPEQLADYRKSVEEKIKSNFSVAKDEAKKTKSAVTIDIDSQGKLSKIEISSPSGVETIDKAVLKAIKAGQPFPNPPHTKDNSVEMQVTTDGADLAVKEI